MRAELDSVPPRAKRRFRAELCWTGSGIGWLQTASGSC